MLRATQLYKKGTGNLTVDVWNMLVVHGRWWLYTGSSTRGTLWNIHFKTGDLINFLVTPEMESHKLQIQKLCSGEIKEKRDIFLLISVSVYFCQWHSNLLRKPKMYFLNFLNRTLQCSVSFFNLLFGWFCFFFRLLCCL